MATQSHTRSAASSSPFFVHPFASRSSPIDLTLDDDPAQDHSRHIKKARIDLDAESTPSSDASTPSRQSPSPNPSPRMSLSNRPPMQTGPRDYLSHVTQSEGSYRPYFSGPSESSAFFPNRNVQSDNLRSPSATGSFLSNGSQQLERKHTHLQHQHQNQRHSNQIIDLTSSPSPPPSSLSTPQTTLDLRQAAPPPGALDVPPKTPVCIGQLTVTALVLYPISYLQPQGPSVGSNSVAEWAGVRLFYDASIKERNPNAEETIHIRAPPFHSATREVLPGENFGVVEQKVASVLGPMLAKGLIRIDAKVRRGVPNLPILPLQMLIHTPNGNIPIVSRYLQQSGLLLDHPSSIWDPARLQQLLYLNPHNPPPGGHARNFNIGPSRYGQAGPNRWNSPAVSGKSVEVQRSQVDEVFKTMRSGDDLEETDPGPNIATTLYPHQKKALTFLLEREREIQGPDGKSSSLWQLQTSPHYSSKSWVNLVTRKEVFTEPTECKGALLADDMGLGKTITCLALISVTLSTAREFSQVPLPELPKHPHEQRNSDPDSSASHFAGSVWGMPDVSTSAGQSSAKKKAAQKEQDKYEAEYVRARRIKVRSRATLIVCPLSTVVNWEEQFREHWAGEVQVVGGAGTSCNASSSNSQFSSESVTQEFTDFRGEEASQNVGVKKLTSSNGLLVAGRHKKGDPLKVYVYHGNMRRPDAKFLADFDAVITTYATLASEFSKQTRSISILEGDDEGTESGDANDSSVAEYDESGNQIVQIPQAKPKQSLKRKKQAGLFSDVVEATSPLQSVYWFRVVLDEAHSIKETSTVASRASCDLQADRRLCLTGTPVQNKLDDVYALIKFLRLNPFEDKNVWQEFIGVPVKFGQPIGVARLQTVMKSITLRRTKESKAENGRTILNLPPRRDELRLLKFDEEEQRVYDEFYKESSDEFKQLSHKNEVMKNYVGILQKILRLRQICDHFELVEGKDLSDSEKKFKETVGAISRDGINVARANTVFSIIRDSGTAQCVECGCELGTPADTGHAGLDDETPAGKRGRKSKNSSRVPTRQSSPIVYRPVLTRCQHLFCLGCFQSSTFPDWPEVSNGEPRSCPVCQSLLRTLDAVEVNPDCTTAETLPKKVARRERRLKGVNLENFRPSTKVKALLGDLIAFSRMNPYSANFDPNSIEIQMVDEKGNIIGDNIVKTVVFSQWTTMLDKVEDALEAAGICYERLDGTMKRDERTRAMEALKNEPACEVLLVSLKAGGVGLNLTAAQRVYLMDPYWNPAVENQAVDRIHRLGQRKPVTTVKLIIENTIEARLLEVQKKKTELAKMTLGTHLSKAEVQQRRMEELNQLFHG
ncbi:hypothetical protein A7U60_g5006 [Sanghuangporus baumii]|uniref:Uncharacterized protein n=1 Tax=Sanghuangporus baumii TaxID=108892 RepID=A0A9Q5N8K2_SANBA|nr:hypothetical protein A7U60_g5006 [Sanghuangporus baumii]